MLNAQRKLSLRGAKRRGNLLGLLHFVRNDNVWNRLSFEFWSFEFVSRFGFRTSYFLLLPMWYQYRLHCLLCLHGADGIVGLVQWKTVSDQF